MAARAAEERAVTRTAAVVLRLADDDAAVDLGVGTRHALPQQAPRHRGGAGAHRLRQHSARRLLRQRVAGYAPGRRRAGDEQDRAGDGLPGAVQEVDARTGQLRWRVRYGPDEPLVESFVVGAGTVVLAVARDRSRPPTTSATLPEALLAVDLRTGRRLWSRRISPLASQASAATIVGPDLVLAGLSGQLTALDARTGAPRWTVGQGPRSPACPSQSFGDVQLSSPGPMLLAARRCPQAGALVQGLDPTTGRVQWTFHLDKHHVGGTSAAGVSVQAQGNGTIFAVADTFDPGRDLDADLLHALLPAAPNAGKAGGNILLALDAKTGHVRWAAPGPDEYLSTGARPVCSFDTQAYQCRDSRTGHLTVQPPNQPLPQRFSAYGEAPLAQTDPLVFLVTTGAHPALEAIDTHTGATVGQTPLSVSGVSAPYTV